MDVSRMSTRPINKFNGVLWGFLVVLVMGQMVASESEEEWESIYAHGQDLKDAFGDPFHTALNSLSAWMDHSIEPRDGGVNTDGLLGDTNDTQLRYYLPSPNSEGNVSEQCRWDVDQIIKSQEKHAMRLILKEEQYWPILMPDSWGKVPDGIFSGNLMPVGMMEECTSVIADTNINSTSPWPPHVHTEIDAHFKGQYCFVVYGNKGPPIYSLGPDYAGSKKDEPATIPPISGHIPNFFWTWGSGSSYGTCMPDSCSPDDFKISLNEVLPEGYEAFWVHCHTKDEEQVWEAKDIAFVCVMGCLGFLVILGAAVDLTINYLGKQELRKGPAQYILVFSGYSNMSKIFHINTKENPNNINCLHGMRVLSMTWVVWGHQWSFLESTVVNFMDLRYILHGVLGQTLLNAQVSVDSFFFLSGLLVAYGLMKTKHKMDLFNFFMFYFHRFLRLAPPIACVGLFTATIARFFSTGPLGEAMHLMNMDMCNDNWIYDTLFMNNLNMRMCLGQTWYTSVDMQIYVLVPLLFFPLMYYGKIGAAWLMLMTVVSIVIPAVISEIYELPLQWMMIPFDKSYDFWFLLYMGTWSRMTPYLVGLWAGYLIYRSNKRPIKMEWWQVTLGWVTAIIVACLVLYGIYPYNSWNEQFLPNRNPVQFLSDMYNGCLRGAWALALMWVVIACHTGYGGPVNSFLGHPSWQPLSRLTYGIYLIHITVIFLIIGSRYTLKAYSHLEMIVQTCGTLFISGIAAVGLSLLIEGPILGLEKLLLRRTGGEHKSAKLKE